MDKERFEILKNNMDYLYDSLVLRYMRAREAQCDLETLQLWRCNDANTMSKYTSLDNAMIKRRKFFAEPDILKFIQLLNEAMGEHN